MKWILLGAAALLALWFLGIYNRFVRLRNLAQEAWSGVDVQLKRRWGGAIHDGWSRDTLFFRPFDLTAANLGFLSRCPLVVRRRGRLVGKMTWGVPAPLVGDVERIAQNYLTPGLERFRVYSLGQPGADAVAAGVAAGCELVDLSSERDPAAVLCQD